MEESSEGAAIALPVVWTGGDEVPILAANQVVVVTHEGDIVVSLGMLVPPMIRRGSVQEDLERVREVGYVQVRTVGRFVLTRRRLAELGAAIQGAIDIYDRQQDTEEGASDDD